VRSSKKITPTSPGEILQEEFLKPLGLAPYRLAKDIDVPATRVYDIVSGKRAVTAETDLLLCGYFGLSDGCWLAVQSHHDTHVARRELGKRLDAIPRYPLLDEATAR
jgi:antitoxin HigA-1